MTIQVPDEIAKAAKVLSKSTGVSAEQLLVDALRAHFPPITPELQAELDAWELASDQDAARVEQSLGPS